jgi:hypothetical protein
MPVEIGERQESIDQDRAVAALDAHENAPAVGQAPEELRRGAVRTTTN